MKSSIGSRTARWLVVAAMCALPVQGFAGNVNTSDIVDGAVTTPKIADGAVTDVKITGPISGSKLATGSITSNAIANGAVTDEKIAGTISGSKLGVHVHDGADLLNGTVSTSKIADGAISNAKIETVSASKLIGNIGVDRIGTYSGVKIVHKGAADGINTFNSISSAIGSIADSSATNRYAIVVMPGAYEEVVSVGSSYIDIIGQSKTGTIIKGGIISSSSMLISNITVEDTSEIYYPIMISDGANNVEINNCIINANYYAGIKITPDANVVIDSVKINISGLSAGIWMSGLSAANKILVKNALINGPGTGLVLSGSDAYMNHFVTIKDSIIETNYGIHLTWAKASMENVTIKTSVFPAMAILINQIGRAYCDKCNIVSTNYAFYVDGDSNSILEINNSNISGGAASNIPIKIGNSKLVIPSYAFLTSGNAKLVNCYDGNYDAIPNGAY